MKEQWKVHSFVARTITVPAKTEDGHVVDGIMNSVEIELVPLHRHGKTITLHPAAPTADDLTNLKSTFPVDGIVEPGEWTLVEAPKAPAPTPAAT